MSLASSSQLPTPRATATNTTSDTGRNVPVPDRCMSNGGGAPAPPARGAPIRGGSGAATPGGGGRGGGGRPAPAPGGGGRGGAGGAPLLAGGPPPSPRQSTSSCAHGSG